MPDAPEPTPDNIAPLLRLGLEDAESAAQTLDATIRVDAPTPRTGSVGTRGWSPPNVEELQKLLPQYDISAFIARGGMGAVYKGTQKTLKRPVAIKVLPPEIEDGDAQFAARFKHEAQAMAQLSHPNIVAVFDAGETPDGLLYFVMEFIEGTDVAQLIASEGQLDPLRAIQITTAVCEALAFAHEEGIIHRDIKPSNIMIDRRGRVKVADFGLAKTVNLDHSLQTQSNMALGTPDFIAPEAMIPGMKLDQRADIYAVGVMLYQMLTGHIPRGRFELPSGVVPRVDKGFDAVVDKAMQTDREKRYSTATEMKKDVESVVMMKEGGAGTHSRPHSIGSAATKKEAPKSGRLPLLLAAAAVVVLGGAAWFALRDSSRQEQAAQVTLPADAGLQASSGELSRSASLPVSNSPAFPPGQWVKVAGALNDLPERVRDRFSMSADGRWFVPQGMQGLTWPTFQGSNCGIRGVFRREGANFTRLEVRRDTERASNESYTLGLVDPKGVIQMAHFRQHKYHRSLASHQLPAPLPDGEEYSLEFYAIGTTLIGKVNGQVKHRVQDSTLLQGFLGLMSWEAFRDVEVINLDGLSEAEARKLVGIDETNVGLPTIPTGTAPQPKGPMALAIKSAKPGEWVPVIFRREDPALAEAVFTPGGGLHLTRGLNLGHTGKNIAVRARLRRPANVQASGLQVRVSGPKHVSLYLGATAAWMDVRSYIPPRSPSIPLKPNEGVETPVLLQLTVIGTQAYGSVDGRSLPPFQLNEAAETGGVAVWSMDGEFSDVAVMLLDGLSVAEALKAAGVASSPPNAPNSSATTSPAVKAGQWIDATAEVKQNGLERNLLSVEGDWLIAKRGINYFPVSGTLELADAAVRVVFRGRVQVKLRQQPVSEKLAGYITSVGNGKGVGIGFISPTAEKEWLKPDIDLGQTYQPDEEHELVFAVHNNQLIFIMDGSLIARVQDARFQKGKIELATLMDQANDPNPTRIKKVEYMSLDGLSEAEALKAAGVGE